MFNNIISVKKNSKFNKSLFQTLPNIFISIILAPARVTIFNSQQKPISISTESFHLNYYGSCQESLFFNSQQKFISTILWLLPGVAIFLILNKSLFQPLPKSFHF